MRVQLDQVQQEPLTWQEEVQLSTAEIAEAELTDLSPLSCRGEIRRTEDGFLVEARLRYSQTSSCHRCLEPTREDHDYGFEVLVLPESEEEPGEQELEAQDLDVLRLAGEELDTLSLIREQVMLNVPMKPLCSQDCRGLCGECGANLNEEPCSCRRSNTDPRWQGLSALRDRLEADASDSAGEHARSASAGERLQGSERRQD